MKKLGAILAIAGEGLEKGHVRGKGKGRIRRAEVNMTELVSMAEKYRQILTRKELRKVVRHVHTLYKKKGVKVLPANIPLPDGIRPGGEVTLATGLEGKEGKKVPRGSRLTEERLAAMRIGEGFLSEKEKTLFVDILYEYEGAIAFEDSEMGLLNPEIEPPAVIHTIPHEPWQQPNLRLPKRRPPKSSKSALPSDFSNILRGPTEAGSSSYRRSNPANIVSLMTCNLSMASRFVTLACHPPPTSSRRISQVTPSSVLSTTTPATIRFSSTYALAISPPSLLSWDLCEKHDYHKDGRIRSRIFNGSSVRFSGF